MDNGVGLALEALQRNGLVENTVIVFTSDNGGVSAGDGKATANLPLRGGKGRQWEGGIREPYYIVWPGVAQPGSTCDVPVTGADFYPTLLEMARLPLRPQQHVDGCSLVPLLKGHRIANRPLYWHYRHYGDQGGEPSSILRRCDWKLIHYYENGRDELYNVVADQGEQEDLASSEPARVQSMRQQLDDWLKSVGARTPVENPNFDAALYERQRLQTRDKTLPNLEAQAAAFLKPTYNPKRWWGSED